MADHSIPVATTVQLAPGPGFWEGAGLLWRELHPVCVERVERVSQQVRDMDVVCRNPLDMRRLEVVADGLPRLYIAHDRVEIQQAVAALLRGMASRTSTTG